MRVAFVDDQLSARQFHTNDVVRKPGVRGIFISPYVGKVLWANVSTGKIMVQWPWGSALEDPTELIIDRTSDFEAPSYDQSYSSYEGAVNIDSSEDPKAKSRQSTSDILAMKWDLARERAKVSVHRAMDDGLTKSQIVNLVSSAFPLIGKVNVSTIVDDEFRYGRRLAIYWRDKKRLYRVTQKERASGVMGCPRCKGALKRRVYREAKRIWMCRTCGFSIHPEDLC